MQALDNDVSFEKNNSYKRSIELQLTDSNLQEGVDELNRMIERLKIDLKRHDNDAASQFLSLEDKINQHYVSKYEL